MKYVFASFVGAATLLALANSAEAQPGPGFTCTAQANGQCVQWSSVVAPTNRSIAPPPFMAQRETRAAPAKQKQKHKKRHRRRR